MTADSVAYLVAALRELRVLKPVQMDELSLKLQARFTNPQSLARELLQRGWLTALQANYLLSGRSRELSLGSYLLLERLGEGGTGQVFKALHQLMNRVVALKIIRKELTQDADVIGRFYREIQVVSQLDHPHIVHAYDAGPIGQTHVLVMEYVAGTDLARVVTQGGPLAAEHACEYIRQTALGLQHAHERGLVHRDIKPSNLLLCKDSATGLGTVKLLDLGLARFQRNTNGELNSLMTPTGPVTMGTPDYLAPEQAIDFHNVDGRADIYSLGCTFYFLLTGSPPFPRCSFAEKLIRHQQADPPPLERINGELRTGLEPIIYRMMAKRPENRYANASELARALATLAGDQPAPAIPHGSTPHEALRGPLSRLEMERHKASNRRRALGMAGAATLLGATLLGIWTLLPGRPSEESKRPNVQVVAFRPTSPVKSPVLVEVLDDFESGPLNNWWPYVKDPNNPPIASVTRRLISPGKVGKSALQVDYVLPGGITGGVVRAVQSPLDWSKYRQFQFWFFGNNTNASLRMEISNDRYPAVAGTLVYDFRDNFTGWRHFRLPWSAFARRDATPGKPFEPFNLTKITGLILMMSAGKGWFQIDQIELTDSEG